MDWSDIAGIVGKAAPVIGGVLGGPAGAAAGAVLSSVLGVDNNPEAIANAVRNDPEAAVRLREAELEHAAEMQRLLLQGEAQRLQAETQQMISVNKTMQAELQADGLFKSAWRPAIGWVMAVAFALVAASMCYTLVLDPSRPPEVMDGVITLIIAMGGVLGVNIHSRSRDKQIALTGKTSRLFGARND